MRINNLEHRVFGRLTVVARVDARAPDGSVLWRTRCACGTEHVVRATNLRNGRTKSCGCLLRETASATMRVRQMNVRGMLACVKALETQVTTMRMQLDALRELVEAQGARMRKVA